eukprot:829129_1
MGTTKSSSNHNNKKRRLEPPPRRKQKTESQPPTPPDTSFALVDAICTAIHCLLDALCSSPLSFNQIQYELFDRIPFRYWTMEHLMVSNLFIYIRTPKRIQILRILIDWIQQDLDIICNTVKQQRSVMLGMNDGQIRIISRTMGKSIFMDSDRNEINIAKELNRCVSAVSVAIEPLDGGTWKNRPRSPKTSDTCTWVGKHRMCMYLAKVLYTLNTDTRLRMSALHAVMGEMMNTGVYACSDVARGVMRPSDKLLCILSFIRLIHTAHKSMGKDSVPYVELIDKMEKGKSIKVWLDGHHGATLPSEQFVWSTGVKAMIEDVGVLRLRLVDSIVCIQRISNDDFIVLRLPINSVLRL